MTDGEASVRAFLTSPAAQVMEAALDIDALLEDAIAIQQIPAPTFSEATRAAYIAQRFSAAGLSDIARDDVENVYGRWSGRRPDAPALLISAHTDTVFPQDADLTIRHDDHDQRIYGPGLGDNSLGVAGLLGLLRLWAAADFRPDGDVWLVANTREEGLGNLDGIRAVWKRLGSRLGAGIVLEGMALGRIYHAGIAVRRLHITCRTGGGHSWTHFGQPSAIHELIAAGARMIALSPPRRPRTTYNIGLISGGQSVNSLASHAELYLDLRSEDPTALAALEASIREIVTGAMRPSVAFEVAVVGDRPSGRIPIEHPLVQLAAAALHAAGHKARFETGSTDANALLACGLPAVTVGLTTGGNSHRPDEYINLEPLRSGMWQIALLASIAAQHVAGWGR